MATALPLESRSLPEGKPATFGTTSLVFAILTIVLPVLLMIFIGYKADAAEREANNQNNGLLGFLLLITGIFFAGIVSGLSSLVGTLTGVAAFARGERHAWRAVVGLVVNAPVLVCHLRRHRHPDE